MYKRILTIQDISCFGQCSLTVALPIISACGVEAAVLPSAVLSTHTGCNFSGYTFRDLTEDMPAISAHWKKENITFDSFYTGYLGSKKQVEYVQQIMDAHGNPGATKIIDPVLGDNGKLYAGFDAEFVEAMKNLVACADVIMPNITEASLLTGIEYRETYDETYVRRQLEALEKIGTKAVILTGISYKPETTGIVIYEQGNYQYYEHKRIPRICHGTGDIIASAYVGALARGIDHFTAVKIAADYTLRCIENTVGDEEKHFYGVKFETALLSLAQAVESAAK